jgi:hypothetical protein
VVATIEKNTSKFNGFFALSRLNQPGEFIFGLTKSFT